MIEKRHRGIDSVLGGQFYLAHRYARAASNKSLAPDGIDLRHLAVLADLDEHGPSKQRELVDRIRMDRTSMVYVLDTLEGRGLAERRRDEYDRRSYAVHLTDQGRKLLRRVTRTVDQTMNRLLSSLTEREKEQLSELLGKLLADITED